jgi:hypothetical protein
MPVNGLLEYLETLGLVKTGTTKELRNMRMGVDASYWLGSIRAEGMLLATSGVPDALRQAVRESISKLGHEASKPPLVVFNGLTVLEDRPSANFTKAVADAWASMLEVGDGKFRESSFAKLVPTAAHASFSAPLMEYLKGLGYVCLRAPRHSWSQLGLLVQSGDIGGHPAFLHAVHCAQLTPSSSLPPVQTPFTAPTTLCYSAACAAPR